MIKTNEEKLKEQYTCPECGEDLRVEGFTTKEQELAEYAWHYDKKIKFFVSVNVDSEPMDNNGLAGECNACGGELDPNFLIDNNLL